MSNHQEADPAAATGGQFVIELRDASSEPLQAEQMLDTWSEFERVLLRVRPPYSIAVDGVWGSGKTKLLRGLFASASQSWPCVWFSAWEYAICSVPIVPAMLRKISAVHAAALNGRVARTLLWGGAATAADAAAKFMGLGTPLSDLVAAKAKLTKAEAELLNTKFALYKDPVEAIKRDFLYLSGRIATKSQANPDGRPLLVFMDDLDRLVPDEALTALQGVRSLLACWRTDEFAADDERRIYGYDLPPRAPVIFICAADLGSIRAAVAARYKEATASLPELPHSFVNKLFALRFFVPVLQREPLAAMLEGRFSAVSGQRSSWNWRGLLDCVPDDPQYQYRTLLYAADLASLMYEHLCCADSDQRLLFFAALIAQTTPHDIGMVAEAVLQSSGVDSPLRRELDLAAAALGSAEHTANRQRLAQLLLLTAAWAVSGTDYTTKGSRDGRQG
ncbi:MAG: hypothetical protein HZB16_21400 [Armatimonadetes bacterium]|nr:hypothetical protein [Armatimonadota bacterium]